MSVDAVWKLSASELVEAYRARTLSPVEVTRTVLDRIDRINPKLNAYCTLLAESALEAARQAEEDWRRGDPGALCGVPVSIKDNLYVKDCRTTFGSKLLEDNVTREDAPVVQRLRRAGAVIVGRTNTPEYGWKGVTDNRVFGVTRNPWNVAKTPGGSSGGASSAVAAGLGPIGIGTDGGGSIRIPATCCGLVGLKASLGRIPNYPATAVDSLRHTGPITRTVADAALVLNVLAGPDERDPHSLPEEDVDYLEIFEEGIDDLRIAYSADLGYAQVDDDVARAAREAALALREAGAVVEEVELGWGDPYDCWKVFFHGGIAGALQPQMAERGQLLDPGLREVVESGLRLSMADYVKAMFARAAFWQDVRPWFERFDLLVTPGLATAAFDVGHNDPPGWKQTRPLSWTPFTYPFNLTGQPAISVPCGFTANGLPLGVQIVGRRFDDVGVLRAAVALERLRPWAERWPEA